MVYHKPWDNSWRNSKCLGPLRILTSDEKMAELIRGPFVSLVYLVVATVGISALITRAGRFWDVWGPDWVANGRGSLDFTSWNVENLVLWIIIGLLVLSWLKGMWERFWWHVKFTPLPEDQKSFFCESQDDGSAPPSIQEKLKDGWRGVMFNKARDNGQGARKGAWQIFPGVYIDAVLERSFGVVGQTFWSFIKSEFTTGLEYPFTSFLRMIGHYCCCGAYGGTATRESLYSVALNTSMAAFIDGRKTLTIKRGETAPPAASAEPDSDNNAAQQQEPAVRVVPNPSYGNVVGKNITLPFAEYATRKYNEIEWMLDHETQELVGCKASWTGVDGLERHECFGMKDPKQNTGEAAENLNEEEQIHQVALIMIVCVAYQLHGTTHWWSNGAVRHLISEEEWPLVAMSEETTQYMNFLATFGSPKSSGWSAPQTAQILASNAAQGMPFHNYIPEEVAQRSKFHQMAFRSKAKVIEKLGEQRQGFNYPKTDAIISTTVMHTAEHYYLSRDAHIFNSGNCVLLETDTSGLAAISMPIAYWTFKSLLRQHLDDSDDPTGINKAIYDTCSDIDYEFAYNYLAIGCSV